LKFFARVKPGEEEKKIEDKQKQLDDEQLYIDGWKVLGTVKNNQDYIKPPFIQEVIEVLFKYYLNWYTILFIFYSIKIVMNCLIILQKWMLLSMI
jgi:hypothetical protein